VSCNVAAFAVVALPVPPCLSLHLFVWEEMWAGKERTEITVKFTMLGEPGWHSANLLIMLTVLSQTVQRMSIVNSYHHRQTHIVTATTS
jgi:hypothetical protein